LSEHKGKILSSGKTFYGEPKGTQPTNGRMSHSICNGSIPGFKCNRFIQIHYSFPSGIQGPEHPCPGKRYSGTERIAYLPNTTDGQRILRLLEAAFDHHLVFTVGNFCNDRSRKSSNLERNSSQNKFAWRTYRVRVSGR